MSLKKFKRQTLAEKIEKKAEAKSLPEKKVVKLKAK